MRRSVGTAERVILGGLALLWAGVLPWLCWGAWGQPGHPHAAPHWVFAPPPVAPSGYVAATQVDDVAHVHDHTHRHDPAPGPARPDTLLVALLLVVWPAAWTILLGGRPVWGRRVASLSAASVWPRIPTPPPRPWRYGPALWMRRVGSASSTSL